MMQQSGFRTKVLSIALFVASYLNAGLASSLPPTCPEIQQPELLVPNFETSIPFKEDCVSFKYGGETFKTYYKVFGDLNNDSQIPLVAIHGGPGLTHDYLLPISDVARDGHAPVIFYDQIGNGRSTHLKQKPPTFWTVDLFVNELYNLLRALKIQNKYNILGHSWGGELAAEFAVTWQSYGLKKLILSDAPASSELMGQSVFGLLQAFPKDVQEGVEGGLADPQKYFAAFSVFSAVHGCTVVPVPLPLNVSFGAVFGPHGDTSVAAAPFQDTWTIIGRIQRIKVPTLLLNGQADQVQDFVMQPYFDDIRHVKWRTFGASSHTPFWEERDKYMAEVETFLSGKC